MPDKLDLTQPVRFKGNDESIVTILATGVTQAIPGITATFEGGETVLARVQRPTPDLSGNDEFIGYFYDDGRLSKYDKNTFLVNYVPPVVVKHQRDVSFYPKDYEKISTSQVGAYHGPQIIGTVEFTVTDGKLTNVEIINED